MLFKVNVKIKVDHCLNVDCWAEGSLRFVKLNKILCLDKILTPYPSPVLFSDEMVECVSKIDNIITVASPLILTDKSSSTIKKAELGALYSS